MNKVRLLKLIDTSNNKVCIFLLFGEVIHGEYGIRDIRDIYGFSIDDYWIRMKRWALKSTEEIYEITKK